MTYVKRIADISNERGLHARAAAKLAAIADQFKADILVRKGGQHVSALSIMGLMMLAASKGSKIELKASGPDAEAALDAICRLIDDRFQED